MTPPKEFEEFWRGNRRKGNLLTSLGIFVLFFPLALFIYFELIHFFYYYPIMQVVFVVGAVSSWFLVYFLMAKGQDLKNLRE